MSQSNELTNERRKYIFICIIISCIANTFLATALTTALPSIMEDLNVSASTGQWLTSGYSLAMGIVMPLTAFLITRFSSRNLYISAIGISLIGLCMASVANGFNLLMLARIFQAVGNGILSAMAQVILLSIYPPEKRGSVMGWYGLSIGAAPVIAPTLAGVIVDILNWRAIFHITLVIMFVTLIFAIKVFEDVLETRKIKFDTISFVLSGIAFSGITLGIGNMGAYAFTSIYVIGTLLVGIITTVIFSYRQFHMSDPFLDLSVMSNKEYRLSVITNMILYLIMMGPAVIMPMYIQTILERPATISGLVMLPGSICMMIINPYAGKVYDKIGIKKLFVIGSIILLISTLGMATIHLDTSLWVTVVCNAMRNISIACLLMPLVTWGISNVDSGQTAHGSAVLTALRAIAGAVGAAVFLNIMNFVAKNGSVPMSKEALMHGINVSYMGMSLLAVIMVYIGVFMIKGKKS